MMTRQKATIPLDFRLEFVDVHCTAVGQVISRSTLSCTLQSYTCTDADILTQEKRDYFTNLVIPRALSFWESSLSVDVAGTLSVNPTRCCGITVPAVSTPSNYVLYVTFQATDGAVLATAGSCVLDSLRRPIAGIANFGPNKITVTNGAGVLFDAHFHTVAHELSHALGFASNHFANFKNRAADGTLQAYATPSFVLNTDRGKSASFIQTPRAVAAANRIIGGSGGVELEDSGTSTGSAGSHWEKRLLGTEFMTASIGTYAYISEITLSLFEDMGWYQVNYDSPEIKPVRQGRGKGDLYRFDLCSNWGFYFCSQSSCGLGCTPDRLSKGICTRGTFSSALPTQFQYFPGFPNDGGGQTEDFCPLISGFSNGFCNDVSQTGSQNNGEIFGPTSFCFDSAVKRPGIGLPQTSCGPVGQFCHRSQCINAGSLQASLRVFFTATADHFIDCPPQGGPVDVYENLSSRIPNCADDPTFLVNAGGFSNCASFLSASTGQCIATNPDLGQFNRCPLTCRRCSVFEGIVQCPPVSEVCFSNLAAVVSASQSATLVPASSSNTVTSTTSPSKSSTATRSPTQTPTSTRTSTSTPSSSPSVTATSSPTKTSTVTSTPTVSPTRTPSNTPSATVPSQSPTSTASPSRGSSPSQTSTTTPTSTATPTTSQTPSRTVTPTSTATGTSSPTGSSAPTQPPTSSVTPSSSLTATQTRTPTTTQSPTRSATQSQTPSNTPSVTNTPSNTPSSSVSSSHTCIACPQGQFAQNCSVASVGVCVACEACPDSFVRNQCQGASPGTCVKQTKAASTSGAAIGGAVGAGLGIAAVASVVVVLVRRRRSSGPKRRSKVTNQLGSPTSLTAVSAFPAPGASETDLMSFKPTLPVRRNSAQAPAVPPPKPKKPSWERYETDDGKAYWYNPETQESVWNKPVDDGL
eukprot:c8899_g1_i1.p1 GENE.c8899_g1_i1~~c8899_g1_i1.p1  ORF type:complete len:970 (+),score=140.40 c8899_g1_i1:148-2910(+)